MVGGFLGIDVQPARGCPYVALDAGLRPHASGWLADPAKLLSVVTRVSDELGSVAVGIDAPRQPLLRRRAYYWTGQKWRPRRPSEKGYGRHCEVVLSALKIARPQWTPLKGLCPDWMDLGFRLFEASTSVADTHEVFPTASYHQLSEDDGAVLSISLKGFAQGPKDMLDAYVAAFTVHEYLAGRGTAVGGGDGLGTIVLPRPLSVGAAEVLAWPEGGVGLPEDT